MTNKKDAACRIANLDKNKRGKRVRVVLNQRALLLFRFAKSLGIMTRETYLNKSSRFRGMG